MNRFGAIILAGGQSRRMGSDKAELKIGNATLLERLLDSLSSVVSQAVVMSAQTQSPSPVSVFKGKLTLAKDSESWQGPLWGIADALPFLDPELSFVFVLGCDLPYLTAADLEHMKSFFNPGVDIVYTEDKGVLNPLPALYRKEVLLEAAALLKDGRRSLIELRRNKKTISIPPPPGNLRAYSDANTPEDFEKARKFHALKEN